VGLWAGAGAILPADLHAAAQKEGPQKPVVTQRLFASPEEAAKALQTAIVSKDKTALREIFGAAFDGVLTGDEVQDANNAQGFATALAQGCQPVNDGEDKITFEVGTNNWPMAIPVVKADGQWHLFNGSAPLGERVGVRGNWAAELTLPPKTTLARGRPSLNRVSNAFITVLTPAVDTYPGILEEAIRADQ